MKHVICPVCGGNCVRNGKTKSGSQRCTFHAFIDEIGEKPSTNNQIEGGVNARLREALRNHRVNQQKALRHGAGTMQQRLYFLKKKYVSG